MRRLFPYSLTRIGVLSIATGLSQAITVAAALVTIAAMAGCGGGGGGGGTSSTGPGGGTTGGTTGGTSSAQTTTFHVDVASGQVTITPPAGQMSGAASAHAVFTGSSVSYNSSLLLDQPGSVGLKSANVSVTNHWGLPIGKAANGAVTGFRVLFGPITNVGAFSDIRSKSTVTTVAGTGVSGTTDGPVGTATFTQPTGAAVDSSGNVYITDGSAKKIRVIRSGLVSTLNTPTTLTSPYGIAVNPVDGALILTDFTANTIRRVLPDGRMSTIAGTGTAGSGNGAGNTATFNKPTGVAVDQNGNIYLSEAAGNLIRKIVLTGADPANASNYLVSTLAGTGTAGTADGPGTAAMFNQPSGIAVNPNGVVYVADIGNLRIRRIDPAGNVATIAGTGAAGHTDGSGDAATFGGPRGIAVVHNALMVTDDTANVVRQLTLKAGGTASPTSASSWQVQTVAGTGTAGSTDGTGNVATFSGIKLLAADRSGNLIIPEFNSHKVREVTPNSGSFPVGIATGSVPAEQVQLSNADGFIPNTSVAAGAYINYPEAVAAGATSTARSWNFTIPTGVTAFEFTVTIEANTTALTPPTSTSGAGDPSVNVRTYAGSGAHLGYVDGTLLTARFNGPEYIAIDASNNFYLADQFNNRIRRIGANGIVSTIAGDGSNSFADGDGTAAKFFSPRGIAVSQDGSVIFVADNGNRRIRRISFNGGDVTNAENWNVVTIAGTGAQGGNYSQLPGNTATFNGPVGLCMDAGGNLFLTELSGNRVRRIRFTGGDPTNAANYTVDILAGNTGSVAPTAGDIDSANGTSATFNHPNGIAVDGYGNLYVADSTNARIREISGDEAVTTLAGGVSGDTPSTGHVDGAGATARFNSPVGITVNSSNEIFVTDESSNYIRRVSQNGTVTTVAGTGSIGDIDGPGNVATFNGPACVAADTFGNLYIGSVNDNSVRLIQRTISSGTQ